MGCGGIENGRVASPESETCYHNVFLMLHITVIHYLQKHHNVFLMLHITVIHYLQKQKWYFKHLRPAKGSTSLHLYSLNRFYANLRTACIGKGTQHKVKAVARMQRFTDWFVSLLFAKTQSLFLCGIYGFDLILLIWV